MGLGRLRRRGRRRRRSRSDAGEAKDSGLETAGKAAISHQNINDFFTSCE